MSLQYVKGIGPKRAAALKTAGVDSIQKLLYYFPRDYLDRSRIIKIKDLPKFVEAGDELTVIGSVFRVELKRTRQGKRIFFLTLKDDTGYLTCVYFAGYEWFLKAFSVGEVLAVSSVPEFDRLNRVQFIHPEFDRLKVKDEEDDTDWSALLHTGSIIPKYRSTEELRAVGLDNRGFRRIIKNAVLHHIREIEEHLPAEMLSKNSLIGIHDAVAKIHFPKSYEERDAALRRLKFDELFYFQLLLAYRRRELKGELRGIQFSVKSPLARQLLQSLPFELTKAQRRVVREITDDMQSSSPMNRLLQGDVGSGKTIVALFAMLVAMENGFQSVLMAPTEVLAEQHFWTLKNFLGKLPVNIRLLIGGQRKKLREDVLADIYRGSANIVVGTHALIQERVEFANLGFIVIDEQHRFGVAQRSLMREKGKTNPDVLVMTATPIPRTLALTVYGDLDISVIDEMPKNRKPIRTAVRSRQEKEKVFTFVKQEVLRGRQAYIVYPLIEESEKIDLKSAVTEFKRLSENYFPGFRLGLLHGRLASEEKGELMTQFKARQLDILVTTTVIEVGIDVPNATIMIVENAERFGLSQLHQLRGRVGRGAEQSYCILLTDELALKKKTQLASNRAEAYREAAASKKRLTTMERTTDGFAIAEIDLELRGPGDYFGTRQSGLPEFKVADIVHDTALLSLARREAFALVHDDPHLRQPQHQHIRKYFEASFKNFLSYVRVG
ncbi:MAG: ATP-dependent DNA helicase RecG [Bacteroidota bacterium]|nr:ATP-dependent DNA helicase RecG [Bacteroidota bacterium]